MLKLQNTLANQFPVDWFSRNLLLFCSALSIYVATFVGRLSISRVFSGVSPEWFVLGEVRTWAVLFAAILVSIGWKSRDGTKCPANMQQVWRCVGLVVVAQFAVMSHTLFYMPSGHSDYFAWELTTIILVAGILGIAFQVWGMRLVNAMMWIALFFAFLLAAWMLLASLGSKSSGEDRPLATTFTFYRIQIFGGFAALVVLFQSNKMVRGGLLGLCSALCFAAAYLSLSKAALLAGAGGLLLLAAVYVTWFEKLRAVAVVAVSLTATILFIIISGGMFTARAAQGLLGVGYSLNTELIAPPTSEELVAVGSLGSDKVVAVGSLGSDKDYLALDAASEAGLLKQRISEFEAQRRLAAIVACTAGKYPCGFKVERSEQDIADTMLRFRVYIPDFSFRIRLLMHGFSGISKAPWLGNGFGNFHAVAVNLYTKNLDHYFYPHNVVIELLYAAGVLGTLFVSAILLVLVWEVLRVKDKIQPCLPLFAFVMSMGLGSLFGGDYMDFRLVWMGLLLCIMLCEKTVSGKLSMPEAAK